MLDNRIANDAVARTAAEEARWDDCAARLNAIATSVPNTLLRGSGWLMTNMSSDSEWILAGFDAAEKAAAVEGSPLAEYLHRIIRTNKLLDTSGIDWSAGGLQALLPAVALAASWDDTQTETVRAIGFTKEVVTAEAVQAAWVSYKAQQAYAVIRQTRIDWDALAADIRSRIESGQLSRDGIVEAVTQAWS